MNTQSIHENVHINEHIIYSENIHINDHTIYTEDVHTNDHIIYSENIHIISTYILMLRYTYK
jgi:acetyltransferase-like isoleucine patch superfamily enzyme